MSRISSLDLSTNGNEYFYNVITDEESSGYITEIYKNSRGKHGNQRNLVDSFKHNTTDLTHAIKKHDEIVDDVLHSRIKL